VQYTVYVSVIKPVNTVFINNQYYVGIIQSTQTHSVQKVQYALKIKFLSQLNLGVNSRLFLESRLISIFPLPNFFLPVFYIKRLVKYSAENS